MSNMPKARLILDNLRRDKRPVDYETAFAHQNELGDVWATKTSTESGELVAYCIQFKNGDALELAPEFVEIVE